MFKKKIISIFVSTIVLLFTKLALAGGIVHITKIPKKIYATHGFYLGVQAGYGSVNYQNSNLRRGFVAKSIHDTGLAPHLYLGYRFNQYLATELGIIYINRPIFKDISRSRISLEQTAKIKNNIVYLAMRLGIPVWRFNFYVKGGIGYMVRSGIQVAGQQVLRGEEIFTAVYGAGFLFQLGRRWFLDSTWMQAPANSREQLPTTNFFGAGIIYQFFG